MDSFDMNEMQIDVLREIGNIGSGNAATSLSLILQGRINVDVPVVEIANVNHIAQKLGGPENQVAGVLVLMKYEIEGLLLFLLEKEAISHLLKVLLKEEVDDLFNLSEMGQSVLLEISNILSGSYTNAISQILDFKIGLEAPRIAVDMVGAVLNYPASIFGTMSDNLILIEGTFNSHNSVFKSNLLIMPTPDSLQKIFAKLGVI